MRARLFPLLALAGALLNCDDDCVVGGDSPSLAVECSPGELCYRGRCVPGCSPGQELVELCDSDRDCAEPRPRCIDDFCSACEEATSCVPGLAVCRPVSSFERPETPPEPDDGSDVPPGPLDGELPTGVERFPTPVQELPADREITRVLRMVYQRRIELDPSGAAAAANEVSVSSYNVEGSGPGLEWFADEATARISRLDEVEGQELRDAQCEVRALDAADVVPVDIGRIGFEEAASSPDEFRAIRTAYEARFDFDGLGRYELRALDPVDPELFIPSTPGSPEQGNLLSTGVGRAGVTVGGFSQESHVPFDLVPTSSTAFNLARGYVSSAQTERPFVLAWRDPIVSGVVVGESVFVEIIDANRTVRIRCEEREGPNGQPQVVVPASFLQRFSERAGPGLHTLRFGRKNELVVPLRPGPDQLIDATVRVALNFASTILIR
ncbi:MAG: hypothetical protein AAF851_21350 [Myxococcota bacterium]